MSLSDIQQEVAQFNLVRGWDKDTKYLKDFLLNMCEEVGEAWSLIILIWNIVNMWLIHCRVIHLTD